MSNITFGKYIPLDSIVHKMDPRAKIIAMLIIIVSIFFPSGWLGYGIIGLCVFIVVLMSKLNIKIIKLQLLKGGKKFKKLLIVKILEIRLNLLNVLLKMY